jgi:hypothetical protein
MKKSLFIKIVISITMILLVLIPFLFISSCQKDEQLLPENEILKSGELTNSKPILYWGPETFTREKGKPLIIKKNIGSEDLIFFEPSFVIHVQNGDGINYLVSSAVIKIDGKQIFGPSDFSQKVKYLSKEIKGLTANSKLEVELRSSQGSYLNVWIEGTFLLNAGLVAYYTLDGNAIDESGNNNNGMITNPNWSDQGIIGSCMQSVNKGETYIQVSPSPSINIISNQVTVSVWVYMFGSDYIHGQGNGAYAAIKESNDGSCSYGIYVGGWWSGKFQFTTETENGLINATSPHNYDANVWYNITGVYNGTDNKLYVNGELIKTVAQSGNITANDFPFWMGKYCGGGSGMDWCYYGKIDEVRIYNRALSEQEVVALYNQ